MALTGYRVPDIIAVLKLINDNGKDMTTTDFGMFTDNGNILVRVLSMLPRAPMPTGLGFMRN